MKPTQKPECAVHDTFPAEIDNRPGLDRIAYRIGRYGDARRWLLRRLDEEPVLADWTYRGADDPGIALYESAAILIDLLTLYHEVYANEAYLRTATWRESVADLARLLGYRLQPGIGGIGAFAFAVTGSAPVAIPKDFPLKIDLAELSDQANFQTRNAATALPWLSRFTLVRPQLPGFVTSGSGTLVVSSPTPHTFAKGDRLLVGVLSKGNATDPRALDPYEIAIVDSVSEWHGRTVLQLQGSLRKITGKRLSLVAFKLGRTFRYFGHNGPPKWTEADAQGRAVARTATFAERLTTDIPLDSEVNDLPLGTWVAVQLRTIFRRYDVLGDVATTNISIAAKVAVPFVAAAAAAASKIVVLDKFRDPLTLMVARVIDATTETRTRDALTGATTVITVDQVPSLSKAVDIRQVQVDTIEGEPFLVGAPWHDAPLERGTKLAWWGDAAQARDLLHREIAFAPVAKPGYSAIVVDVQPTPDPGISTIALDREVPYPDFSDDADTIAFGNVVHAIEGKQEVLEVLGNGDEQATFQTFEVPKQPLTYLHRAELAPPERPEIEIVVGNRIWKYVPSLYPYGPTDEVYVVREDNDGTSWVQFGDGKTGARLPSGIDNVKIRWRTGAGAFGPAKPGATATAGTRIDAIDEITLPGVISGGSAPESADVARIAAPLRVQSLDRLVSLTDIEAEALSVGGVERVRATWAIVDGLPMVQVTVLMQEKRSAELGDVAKILAAANRTRGPQRFPIKVVAGAFEYVFLDLEVAIDPSFEAAAMRAAVQAALDGPKGLFGARAPRTFGDAEYATRIEGVVQNVPGVMWALVHALGSAGVADDPAQLQFPVAPARAETVACPSTHVLRLGPTVIRLSPGGTP
jgi:hypothetical protein